MLTRSKALDVDCNARRAHWGLRLLQSIGDFRDKREKRIRCRSLAAKSMLMRDRREMFIESREQESFQNLHRRSSSLLSW